MSTEFLMPMKFSGEGCGLSVAIRGLNDMKYSEMVIYIEGMEENKYYVDIDSNNNFKTTSATFEGLKENKFYNVIAELNRDGENIKIQSNMVTSINKSMANEPQVMLLSLDLEDTPTPKYKGGCLMPSSDKFKPKIIVGGDV